VIDRNAAYEIATKAINEKYHEPSDSLVIAQDATIEKDFGWVFFYNSELYLRTGDERYLLAGNAPVIVDRDDGSVEWLGTARPVEEYIADYEQRRQRGKSS
jgi:Immunity protein 35